MSSTALNKSFPRHLTPDGPRHKLPSTNCQPCSTAPIANLRGICGSEPEPLAFENLSRPRPWHVRTACVAVMTTGAVAGGAQSHHRHDVYRPPHKSPWGPGSKVVAALAWMKTIPARVASHDIAASYQMRAHARSLQLDRWQSRAAPVFYRGKDSKGHGDGAENIGGASLGTRIAARDGSPITGTAPWP